MTATKSSRITILKPNLPAFLLACLLACSSSLFGAELKITGLQRNGSQGLLTWTNGRAPFQVQMRSDLSHAWVNVGGLTTSNATSVPVNTNRSYFRVISDCTAVYQVIFNVTWSQATHPVDWPADPHMTGLVGGTHNSAVHFFRLGEAATEATRYVAEGGIKTLMLMDVATAITNGTAEMQLSGFGVRPIPGSTSFIFPQPMRRDFPLVTLLSMVGPSPDWFLGVDSVSLIENDQWVTNKTVPLYVLDSGTDSGVSYASPDQGTVPRGVVNQITGFPALVDGTVPPWGSFTFKRLD
jgi:hypothetical protein